MDDENIAALVNSCKPSKKRGRPSHKRQIQEIREERKINLQTSDSVITAINLKSILTIDALETLPPNYQAQLIKLLPKVDQICDDETGRLKVRDSALSNEYFAKFCKQYTDKLAENKLSDEALEQAKSDKSKELAKLDPWKLKNFEPIWGVKLSSQDI